MPNPTPEQYALVLSDASGPDPSRLEIIAIEDYHLVLAIHESGVTDPEEPATFVLDQTSADQLREVLDRYFPRSV